MIVYLVSNNLVLEGITYESSATVEQKRLTRPLSIEGEKQAQKIAEDLNVNVVYSSSYASALATSKYIANKNNCLIRINNKLNDSKIGNLGKHNVQMLRYMQERNFDFKFEQGESLNETMNRLYSAFKKIITEETEDLAIVTHKRAITGLLLKFCEVGFNLNDRLILMHNENVVLDDTENDIDLIKIEVNGNNIESIEVIN